MQPTYEESHIMTQNTTALETTASDAALDDVLQKRSDAAKKLHENKMLLSLEYLERNELPVFVRNNVNVGAVMSIDFKHEDGKTHAIVIPNTDIPYELTAELSYKAIRTSIGFGRMLRNRTLVLLDPTDAINVLQSPAIARRLARLETSRFSNDATTQAPSSFALSPKITENVVPGAPTQTVAADPISSRARALVGEFQAGNLSPEEFEDSVADNARTFSADDWSWLVSNAGHVGVSNMASQQLSLLAQGQG